MQKTSPVTQIHHTVTAANPSVWYVVGNVGGEEIGGSVLIMYDILHRKWTSAKELPWHRSWAAGIIIESSFALVGGYKNEKLTADVDQYNDETNTWTDSGFQLDPARFAHACCSVAGHHYCAGGWVEPHNDAYNPINRAAVACIPVVTYGLQTSIIIAGGRNLDNTASNVIQNWYPASNEIKQLTTMDAPREALGGAAAGDDIYLIGGGYGSGSTCVEIFNICTGTIRRGTSLLAKRYGCTATTINNGNVICVFGNLSTRDRSVDVMDIREGAWSSGVIIPNLPKAIGFCAFASR